MSNPIGSALSYLQDCGYTEQEAENLLRAPRSETQEGLLSMIDDWVQHVGEHKKYQTCMLDLVAMGFIRINGRSDDGEWLFQLDVDKAIAAGFGPDDLKLREAES